MNRALWWLILHGVILRIRPKRSAHAYRKIWTPAGSPLLLESKALADGLARRLQARFGDAVAVELAMSYGEPSLAGTLERLRRQNVQRLLVLPLYPQYSSTTTGSIFELVTRELGRWRWMPELRFVNQYWQNERYVSAVAESIAEHWRSHGRKHLLFSFHSIPRTLLSRGRSVPLLLPRNRAGGRDAPGTGRRRLVDRFPVAVRPRGMAQAVRRRAAAGICADGSEAGHGRVPGICDRLPRDARGDRYAEPRDVPGARR